MRPSDPHHVWPISPLPTFPEARGPRLEHPWGLSSVDDTPPQASSTQRSTGLTLGPDVARPAGLHRPQSKGPLLAAEGGERPLRPRVPSIPSAGLEAHPEQLTWLPLPRGPGPTRQRAAEAHPASSLPANKARRGLDTMSPAVPAPPPRLGSGHDKTHPRRPPGAPPVITGEGRGVGPKYGPASDGASRASAGRAGPLAAEGRDGPGSSQGQRMEVDGTAPGGDTWVGSDRTVGWDPTEARFWDSGWSRGPSSWWGAGDPDMPPAAAIATTATARGGAWGEAGGAARLVQGAGHLLLHHPPCLLQPEPPQDRVLGAAARGGPGPALLAVWTPLRAVLALPGHHDSVHTLGAEHSASSSRRSPCAT